LRRNSQAKSMIGEPIAVTKFMASAGSAMHERWERAQESDCRVECRRLRTLTSQRTYRSLK
jgi:hypothetical protein